MRNRTTLTVLLFGLLVGISGAAYLKDKSKSERHPAAAGNSMKAKIPWVPNPSGKHLALIKVELSTTHEIPEDNTTETVVRGRILVTQDLQGDLNYSWHVPEDVTVVAGNLKDSLANVKMGQVIDLSLTVIGFSKESQQLISLQASANRGNMVLGGSAILASRPEDTWEAVATEMKKEADAQLGTSPKYHRR